MVMGMPLFLDLGFPMTDPSGNGASTQFHFSEELDFKVWLPTIPVIRHYIMI